jgi:hypothetical protein
VLVDIKLRSGLYETVYCQQFYYFGIFYRRFGGVYSFGPELIQLQHIPYLTAQPAVAEYSGIGQLHL